MIFFESLNTWLFTKLWANMLLLCVLYHPMNNIGVKNWCNEFGILFTASRNVYICLFSNQVEKVLKLWKDGFSIDDGPLRGYGEPENEQFLNSIKKG